MDIVARMILNSVFHFLSIHPVHPSGISLKCWLFDGNPPLHCLHCIPFAFPLHSCLPRGGGGPPQAGGRQAPRCRQGKIKNKLPASGRRPAGGSEIHIVLALRPAGQIFGSEVHIVRSSWGSLFCPKSFISARFYKGLAPKRGQNRAPAFEILQSTHVPTYNAHTFVMYI